MLTVSNMSIAFSGKKLYDDVNVKFIPGNTYGVIGANGAGKSTFLKALEGKLTPTTGTITMDTNERMSSLVQDHFAFDSYTILDTVLQGHKELYDIKKEMDNIYSKDPFTDEDGLKVGELSARFEELDGWNAESEAIQLLKNLDIDSDKHYMLMADVSENIKVKVLLAQALFGNPDILILDEPTNGLDTKTIQWLENFLADYKNIVIVVSHDRHFLNAVSTMILDVDFGKIKLFIGNYDFWKESSELALKLQQNANDKKSEQIKQLQDFIARFSANASKSKQATSRKKQLEKITLDDIQPSTRKYPYIKFNIDRELGNDLLKVENISKTIDGKKLFENISFSIRPNEKTLIMSNNDVVTTTILDILAGRTKPDTGEVIWGVTTSRDTLAKDMNDNFEKSDKPILEYLRNFASKEENDNTFLRGLLGRMLFKGEDAEKTIDVLSGGEKVRVILSKLMLTKANVLILDDPTNHLDLESITSLNDGLVDYKGSLIFASHDHTFSQTIADHIIVISENEVIERSETKYDEFMDNKEIQKKLKEKNIII